MPNKKCVIIDQVFSFSPYMKHKNIKGKKVIKILFFLCRHETNMYCFFSIMFKLCYTNATNDYFAY